MVVCLVHIGRLYKINIIFIISLSRTGIPHPKELRSDIMSHQKENSTLKVKDVMLHNLMWEWVHPFSNGWHFDNLRNDIQNLLHNGEVVCYYINCFKLLGLIQVDN